MADPETTARRAEELADRLLPDRAARLRMLVVVNPHATTVSGKLKSLVVYALQSRYEVETVDTERQGHAIDLCRAAAGTGYDVVVAFGGDGTVNEAANGLVGTDTPLTCLPGGATNVYCRVLGIPGDVVDATEHLLLMADRFEPRRVDLGRVNERHFTFSSGVGLDASVVERVDAHPRLKHRLGKYYFASTAVSTLARRYLLRSPRLRVEVGERAEQGVACVVQNADPYTYFGDRPIRVCEGAGLASGTLAVTVLARATPLDLLTVTPRVLSGSAERVSKGRHVVSLGRVGQAVVSSIDGRPLPVQVDGDFVGKFETVRYGVAAGGLWVVS